VHSNKYTFIYAAILTVVAAVLLALTAEGLRPLQERNISLEKMQNILSAANVDISDKTKLESLYEEKVVEWVVGVDGSVKEGYSAFDIEMKDELLKSDADRNLPLFTYTGDDGKTLYIIPMRGVGLWGPVWGFISLEDDFNTVFAANFDHKGETPGLGAEISQELFQRQFVGKKVFRGDDRETVALKVVKFGAEPDYPADHRIDGISGGTITSVGVSNMLKNGIALYNNYFDALRKSGGASESKTIEDADSTDDGEETNDSIEQ